jgi:hypothetical protein
MKKSMLDSDGRLHSDDCSGDLMDMWRRLKELTAMLRMWCSSESRPPLDLKESRALSERTERGGKGRDNDLWSSRPY